LRQKKFKKEENLRVSEELFKQMDKIKELIKLNDKKIQDLNEYKEKIKIGQVVLMNMIKELTVSELIDSNNYDAIQQRITEVYSRIFREVHTSFSIPDCIDPGSSLATLIQPPHPLPSDITTPVLKEEDNPLSAPIQISIAKISHPYRKQYLPISLLKNDDSYWGSPQSDVISTTSITFDFSKRSVVSKVSIRDRGDRQGVKNFSVSFADEIDGPFSTSFTLLKNKTPFKQSFDISGVGRFCLVTFMTNHGGNVGCKFKVQEVAFC